MCSSGYFKKKGSMRFCNAFSLRLSEDVLGALQEIQGTFQRIQTLSRRQKDHLKRIHNGKEAANGNIFFDKSSFENLC